MNKTWIKNKLEQYRDTSAVYKLYEQFKIETGSTCSLDSYRREVRRIAYKQLSTDIKKDLKIHKSKKLIKHYKRQNNTMLDYVSNEKSFNNIVSEAVKIYKPFDLIEQPSQSNKKVAVLNLSDFHIGSVVTKEDTLGKNEYNFDIAKERLEYIFNETIFNCRETGVSDIVITLLGDLLDGTIHEEILRNSEINIVNSILKLSDLLSQLVRRLTKYFKTVSIYTTVGNHGRILSGSPYYSDYNGNNFETLFIHFFEQQTKDIVTIFAKPDSLSTVFYVFNYVVCIMHGHFFKSVNTIPTEVLKIQELLGINIDCFIMGHFHSTNILHTYSEKPIIINGSLKGGDAFTFNKTKTCYKPSQTLLIFEEYIGLKYINIMRC